MKVMMCAVWFTQGQRRWVSTHWFRCLQEVPHVARNVAMALHAAGINMAVLVHVDAICSQVIVRPANAAEARWYLETYSAEQTMLNSIRQVEGPGSEVSQ